MNTQNFVLQKQAITHAKNGDWQKAIDINQEILDRSPKDIPALNRMGFCYIQLKKNKLAKKVYHQVLEYDRLNSVAKKYLAVLAKRKAIQMKQVGPNQDFIEEPGRSKVVVLTRLSGSKTLDKLPIASSLSLKIKSRYITVSTEDGEYIGSLPEDISFHLASLIKTGNEYVCVLRSASKQECSVFIKEVYRSPENQNTPSFFASTKKMMTDVEEDIMFGDMIEETLTEDTTNNKKSRKGLEEEEEDDNNDNREQLPSDILNSMR